MPSASAPSSVASMLFSAPTYGAFADMAYLNGGVPVSVPVTEEQKFNLPAMKEKIGEKTKIVVICNPNNPTGTYVPIGEPKGSVTFYGKNLLELSPEDRSHEGIFLSFQYPVEIPPTASWPLS